VWVVSKISLHDRAELLDAHNRPVVVKLAHSVDENFHSIDVISPPEFAGTRFRGELVNHADMTHATLTGGKSVNVLAVNLSDDLKMARRVLIADTASSDGRWVAPSELAGGYPNRTPYPLIDAGINGMISRANPLYLWAALLVFPLTYLITSYRWDLLLRVLEIRMALSRAFVLNMVGAFYNTFMPGSTGGDLLKAYYASKLTPHRMRAVMSVLVDRVIGLLALVLLGGVSAATQWQIPRCRQVAMASVGIFAVTGLGLAVLYTPILRKITGFDFLVSRLPMQRHVHTALEAMELYRKRPLMSLWSLIVSIPVHGTVVVSAMLSGLAFGILRDHPAYYWASVPVIVLSGSIPVSPQGVGVMEGFAVLLLRPEGGTVAQAFALTMCIRMVQIFWNLTGGLFVLRGGFHAPSEQEQATMEEEETMKSER
ncbi:MAG: flippase-like domain-containing protein, partial [Phycisphaerae bacterium]|nr:flippase-like domain-containing protein [Phycisphaerae bacterium]